MSGVMSDRYGGPWDLRRRGEPHRNGSNAPRAKHGFWRAAEENLLQSRGVSV